MTAAHQAQGRGMLPESHARLASLVARPLGREYLSALEWPWSHGLVELLGYRLVVPRCRPVTVSLSAEPSLVLLTRSL